MRKTQAVAMRRTLGAALVIAVSLAGTVACGGDDDGGNEGGSGATRAVQPEAQERAESLNLTLSDFPDGWRMSEGDVEAKEENREEFRACTGQDFSSFTIIGESDSGNFAMGETAEVSSEADIFESQQMATEALAAAAAGYEGEEAGTCMTEGILDSSDDDFEFGDIEIDPVSFTPPSGIDEARAWQVVIPIEGASGTESEGVAATAYVDLVALREGDTVVLVQAFDVLSPFDPELRNQLVETIADRISD